MTDASAGNIVMPHSPGSMHSEGSYLGDHTRYFEVHGIKSVAYGTQDLGTSNP